MPQIKISPKWEKNKDFKKPFYYIVGKGVVTDDQAEAYDGDDQMVKVIRLDMADILKLGMADELDFMSKALMTAEAKPDNDDSAGKVLQDAIRKGGNFAKMEVMINKVIQRGIVEPIVYTVPEHEAARQRGLFYVDEIPFDDRMDLFSVIFESEGLSDFREEQAPSVGDVADVPSVQLPPDGPMAELRSNDA